MIMDTHMHTCFSSDATMKLQEAIAQSGELGIGITITEHMDLAYPEPGQFIFDVDAYFREYGPYRNERLLLGVEIGMRPDCLEDNRKLAKGYPFDYIIGSVHVINNIDLYWQSFYEGRTKKEIYTCYFDSMLECVAGHDFIHSLGHIDYIARYAPFADTNVYYEEFKEQIDPVLTLLAKREQALEINTKRPLTPDALRLLVPVYQRFAELGGRYVTIGSDAHRASEIGRDFAAAFDFAAHCGLRPVWFQEGKPRYMRRD
ncbi:putative histidinol-phosphatase [Propionispora sp. 2/2-37]|uniref:histidinol phosphate phosphatase n=1 Tax=Propionispora sp. 2/2-37 TaxID=1677858 RepID=UPI0006BB99E0|nr:histidinol phosphate phosphatase [Propionispora sp. 2/2-37]CUH97673.1 putative histidinol-phosphatase [Propionispora sp. 2/2-37]